MEYAQSYALYNYKRKSLSKGLEYENLELIRTFSGMPAEHGFILVHVAMVAHTGKQVKHTAGALEAIKKGDRSAFNVELRGLLKTLQEINRTMDTMWNHSAPDDYLKFRTFIMGTKNQVCSFKKLSNQSQCSPTVSCMKAFRPSPPFTEVKAVLTTQSFLLPITFFKLQE